MTAEDAKSAKKEKEQHQTKNSETQGCRKPAKKNRRGAENAEKDKEYNKAIISGIQVHRKHGKKKG
jgi:hypothetical protein